MTVFYAYIHNIRDDNTWRIVIVFASRAVADQWWRAISGSPHAAFFQRISPQFYTHDDRCNVYEFFTHSRFKSISAEFRGKMFLTLMNDRGGRGISIIPPQEVTDHTSGNWFYIRSTTKSAMYWHLRDGKLFVSDKARTQFQIKARNLQDGTIMIGNDQITLQIDHRRHVDTERSGTLVESGTPREFRFDNLEKGNFVAEEDGILTYDSSRSRGQAWEIV